MSGIYSSTDITKISLETTSLPNAIEIRFDIQVTKSDGHLITITNDKLKTLSEYKILQKNALDARLILDNTQQNSEPAAHALARSISDEAEAKLNEASVIQDIKSVCISFSDNSVVNSCSLNDFKIPLSYNDNCLPTSFKISNLTDSANTPLMNGAIYNISMEITTTDGMVFSTEPVTGTPMDVPDKLTITSAVYDGTTQTITVKIDEPVLNGSDIKSYILHNNKQDRVFSASVIPGTDQVTIAFNVDSKFNPNQFVSIRAVNSIGASCPSHCIGLTDANAPPAPTVTAASVWDAVDEGGDPTPAFVYNMASSRPVGGTQSQSFSVSLCDETATEKANTHLIDEKELNATTVTRIAAINREIAANIANNTRSISVNIINGQTYKGSAADFANLDPAFGKSVSVVAKETTGGRFDGATSSKVFLTLEGVPTVSKTISLYLASFDDFSRDGYFSNYQRDVDNVEILLEEAQNLLSKILEANTGSYETYAANVEAITATVNAKKALLEAVRPSPTSLSLMNVANSFINNTVSEVLSYFYSYQLQSGSWSTPAPITLTNEMWKYSGLTGGTSHQLRVYAAYVSDSAAKSTFVTTNIAKSSGPPDHLNNVVYTVAPDSSVSVTWKSQGDIIPPSTTPLDGSNGSDITSFIVVLSKGDTLLRRDIQSPLTTLSASKLNRSYKFTNLIADQKYTSAIIAHNINGKGMYTPISFTARQPPNAPEIVNTTVNAVTYTTHIALGQAVDTLSMYVNKDPSVDIYKVVLKTADSQDRVITTRTINPIQNITNPDGTTSSTINLLNFSIPQTSYDINENLQISLNAGETWNNLGQTGTGIGSTYYSVASPSSTIRYPGQPSLRVSGVSVYGNNKSATISFFLPYYQYNSSSNYLNNTTVSVYTYENNVKSLKPIQKVLVNYNSSGAVTGTSNANNSTQELLQIVDGKNILVIDGLTNGTKYIADIMVDFTLLVVDGLITTTPSFIPLAPPIISYKKGVTGSPEVSIQSNYDNTTIRWSGIIMDGDGSILTPTFNADIKDPRVQNVPSNLGITLGGWIIATNPRGISAAYVTSDGVLKNLANDDDVSTN